MTRRINISTGTPWETIVGYSRAVRIGNHIFLSGTTASDEQGSVIGAGDMGAQTDYILRKIERVLTDAGASLKDVVRVRMFVTDISRWEEVGRVHGQFFRDIRPVSTMVEISRLVDPEHLVEIEVDAVIGAAEDEA